MCDVEITTKQISKQEDNIMYDDDDDFRSFLDSDRFSKPTTGTIIGLIVVLAVCVGLIALIEWICPGTHPLLW